VHDHRKAPAARPPERLRAVRWLEARAQAILVRVRVQPGARRRGVGGVIDGRLQLRVTEPPADGRANAAVVELVADLADVAKSAVVVSRGGRGREKTLTISASDPAAMAARLEASVQGQTDDS
jgi:uncharacterized protein (TIGR00251 family)